MKQEPYPLVPTNEWETEEEESSAVQEFVEGMKVIADAIRWAFRKAGPFVIAAGITMLLACIAASELPARIN